MSDVVLSLQCVVTAKPPLLIGAPMRVSGTLRNMGEAAVWIQIRNTFFSREPHHCLVLMHHNEHLQDIAHSATADAQVREFVRVPAGGSETVDMDLAESYAITKPGAYQLALRMPIYAGVEQQPHQQPTLAAHYDTVFVASKPVLLEIQANAAAPAGGGATAASTFVNLAAAPAVAVPYPDKPQVPPDIQGMTVEEKALFRDSNQWAYRAILAALKDVDDLASVSYKGWMDASSGDSALGRRSSVKAALMKMANYMAYSRVVYKKDFGHPRCAVQNGQTPYAFTGRGDGGDAVSLCQPTFTNSISQICDGLFPSDAFARTFIGVHELSHCTANTLDGPSYLRVDTGELAKGNPNLAITCAQNYAYYVMSCHPHPPAGLGPDLGIWKPRLEVNLGRVSPAGVAAASIPKVGAMIVYQDVSTSNRGALWFKFMLMPPGQREEWLPERPMLLDTDMQSCRSYQDEVEWPRPKPALIAFNDEFYKFYCVYVDNDSKHLTMVESRNRAGKSPMNVAIDSRDLSQVTWTRVKNLHLMTKSSHTMGPALAFFRNHFYCVYITDEGRLTCLRAPVGGDFAPMDFSHAANRAEPTNSSATLVEFNGRLYCSFFTGRRNESTGSSTHTHQMYHLEHDSWSGTWGFLDSGLVENISYAPWESKNGSRLVAIGTGMGHTDLRYWISKGAGGEKFDAFWGETQFMAVVAKMGATIVGCGPTLHAFYQRSDYQLMHLST